MRNRLLVLIAATLGVAACSENPVDPSTKVVPGVAKSVGQATLPPRTLVPPEYYRPFMLTGAVGSGEIVSNPAPGSLGNDRPPTIKYWGGGLILQQRLAAIYYSPTTIYQNGPKAGTTGAAGSDNSLVGFFLRNLGASSYWGVNTTYSQTLAGVESFVQHSMTYDSFWAAKSNAARSGATVTDDQMVNLIEDGFNNGTL